jgi:hypothetical protein
MNAGIAASSASAYIAIPEYGQYNISYQGYPNDLTDGLVYLRVDTPPDCSVTATAQYLNNSGHAKALQYFKESSDDLANELSKLISIGVDDPDASTPGLFYFKYLED